MNLLKFVSTALLSILAIDAQALHPDGLNYNASKSNTGNLFISDGTNCTTLVVATDANGNVTGTTTTTAPCGVANGENLIWTFTPQAQIPQVVTQIPQFVDGASWQTTLGIVNTTPSAASASLNCYQETGQGDTSTQAWNPPFIQGSNTQNLGVPAGGTLFLDTPGTSSTLAVGWCQVTASDGVQVYSKFTWSATNGGQGIASASASGSDILVPFDNTNGSSTAIALANTEAMPLGVSVSFQFTDGTTAQSSIALLPLGHSAFLFPQKFPATAGKRGLCELLITATGTKSGGLKGPLALVPLQFNAVNNFSNAQAYPVNNGPIISALDPLMCVQNPLLSACPNPVFQLLTLNANFGAAGAAGSPVVINITPGANGTYNAAISGTINASAVNGSFLSGTLSTGAGGQVIFNFSTPGTGSSFSGGSLSLAFTETGLDSAIGQAVGTVAGQMTLTQAGVGSGLLTGTSTASINYNSSKSNSGN